MINKPKPEPPKHKLASIGSPGYNLINVKDEELVAELIRRGWRGYGRPEQQGMVLPRSKVSSSRGGKH